MRATWLALALLLSTTAPASKADYDAGVTAYREGDYATALREFRALADKGVVIAYTNLAYMYSLGEGVEADMETAARWMLKAAEAGSPSAQLAMGVLYFHGDGVPKDRTQAYAWLNVAAAGGRGDALDLMSVVANRLSEDELRRALALSRELFDEFGDSDATISFTDQD